MFGDTHTHTTGWCCATTTTRVFVYFDPSHRPRSSTAAHAPSSSQQHPASVIFLSIAKQNDSYHVVSDAVTGLERGKSDARKRSMRGLWEELPRMGSSETWGLGLSRMQRSAQVR
jgi:hypothetical protein